MLIIFRTRSVVDFDRFGIRLLVIAEIRKVMVSMTDEMVRALEQERKVRKIATVQRS